MLSGTRQERSDANRRVQHRNNALATIGRSVVIHESFLRL